MTMTRTEIPLGLNPKWTDNLSRKKLDAYLNEVDNRFPEYLSEARNDETYAIWLMLVDRNMGQQFGFTRSGLSTWSWQDSYGSGDSPEEAIYEFMQDQMDSFLKI